ncbi:uncharacterized protein RBU33_026278 isoform 2-T2 [Hipposideros larvatus]
MRGVRKNQQGDSTPAKNIQESAGPRGGDRGCRSPNGRGRPPGRRPLRQRWVGGDCSPRYVSSSTPAPRRLRKRSVRLPSRSHPRPGPGPGPHPWPAPVLPTSWWSPRLRGGTGRRAWHVTRLRNVLATPRSPWLPRDCPAPFHQWCWSG